MLRLGNFEQLPKICRNAEVFFGVAHALFFVRNPNACIRRCFCSPRIFRRDCNFPDSTDCKIPFISSILFICACVIYRIDALCRSNIFRRCAHTYFSAYRHLVVNAFFNQRNLPFIKWHFPGVTISNAPTCILFDFLFCFCAFSFQWLIHSIGDWHHYVMFMSRRKILLFIADFSSTPLLMRLFICRNHFARERYRTSWCGNHFHLSLLPPTRFPMSSQLGIFQVRRYALWNPNASLRLKYGFIGRFEHSALQIISSDFNYCRCRLSSPFITLCRRIKDVTSSSVLTSAYIHISAITYFIDWMFWKLNSHLFLKSGKDIRVHK